MDFHNEGTVQASRDGLKDRILKCMEYLWSDSGQNGSRGKRNPY